MNGADVEEPTAENEREQPGAKRVRYRLDRDTEVEVEIGGSTEEPNAATEERANADGFGDTEDVLERTHGEKMKVPPKGAECGGVSITPSNALSVSVLVPEMRRRARAPEPTHSE